MTTFRQVVSKIQDGLLEEAKVGLEFVLRLDPSFSPGLELQRQLAEGRSSIDLTALISHLDAPSTDTINILLVEAVEEFNQRNYLEAKDKVGKVLLDLPGHTEARNLLGQIDEALKVENQVGLFLTQAREALDRGDPEEGANFVMMAQALDPHHRGIKAMLVALQPSDLSEKPGPTPRPATQNATANIRIPAPTPSDGNSFAPAPDPPGPQQPQQPPPRPASSSEEVVGGEQAPAPDSWSIANAFATDSTGDGELSSPVEPPVSEPLQSDSDISDLFAVESGDFDVEAGEDQALKAGEDSFTFEDSPLPSPDLPLPSVQPAPSPDRSGPDFDDSSEDLGDLFQSDPEIGVQFDPDTEPAPPTGPVDPQADPIRGLIDDANAAWQDGDLSRARDIVEGILATEPGHHEALDLITRIEATLEPVVPEAQTAETSPPEDQIPDSHPEDDSDTGLFAKEFPLPEDVVATPGGDVQAVADRPAPAPARRPASRGFPWRLVNLVGGGIAIVVVTMWLGSGLFSGNGDSEEERAQLVTRRLQEADTLFEQGKAEEALHLLQTFPAEGIEKQRIDKRIARYQESLAPPPPTPIPQAFVSGRDLIDQGRWLEAYWEIDAGLRDQPEDPGLRALLEEIVGIEPEIVSLQASLGKKDFATATSIVSDLENQYPDQSGFAAIHDRSLFNAALSDLRSYNLAGARSYLQKLKQRQPQDPEVVRILEFISSYMNRSVDMQLEIFVGSLEDR